MLRVHAQRATRRTPSSSSHGKRPVTTLGSALTELKQAMRSASVQENPLPRLRQVRQSRTYHEVWQSSQALPWQSPPTGPEHRQQQAMAAADAYATCYALDAVVKLSGQYVLRWVSRSASASASKEQVQNDTQFLHQIRPGHRAKLTTEFRQSWQSHDDIRQAAILSALSPQAAAELAIDATHAHREQMAQWGALVPEQQLSTAECLALVDYVNSGTGTFNAVNGAAILQAYYGDKLLSGLMQTFSTSLDGAIGKLCVHPYFGRTDVIAYKGINLNNQSGRFRREMLENAVGTGKLIAFPNVLSATTDPERSYAVDKYFDGYTTECRIRLRTAFDADPFHDSITRGEQEVIAPAGQRFIITGKENVEVFQSSSGRPEEVERYLLEPAPAKQD